MAPNGKSPNPPDIADASMAYMPKPDGKAAEGADEIQLNNKTEEKKSMADIAEELGKDKVTSTPAPKAVPVAVNGKPREVKKAAPEPAKQAHVPEPAGGGDMGGSDELPAMKSKPDKQPGGKKGLLVALLLIALVAAGVFGYLWYQERTNVAKLESDLAKSGGTQSSATPSPSTAATSDLRTIPELGLTYAFTTNTEAITYRYRELVDADKKVHGVITLSSTKVITAERKVSNSTPKCTAEFGPLGSVTSYQAGESYKGKTIETQAEGNAAIVKAGDTYYVFENAQAACSTDKTVQDAVLAEKENVQTFLKSLKTEEN